jgi:hypothetical protein
MFSLSEDDVDERDRSSGTTPINDVDFGDDDAEELVIVASHDRSTNPVPLKDNDNDNDNEAAVAAATNMDIVDNDDDIDEHCYNQEYDDDECDNNVMIDDNVNINDEIVVGPQTLAVASDRPSTPTTNDGDDIRPSTTESHDHRLQAVTLQSTTTGTRLDARAFARSSMPLPQPLYTPLSPPPTPIDLVTANEPSMRAPTTPPPRRDDAATDRHACSEAAAADVLIPLSTLPPQPETPLPPPRPPRALASVGASPLVAATPNVAAAAQPMSDIAAAATDTADESTPIGVMRRRRRRAASPAAAACGDGGSASQASRTPAKRRLKRRADATAPLASTTSSDVGHRRGARAASRKRRATTDRERAVVRAYYLDEAALDDDDRSAALDDDDDGSDLASFIAADDDDIRFDTDVEDERENRSAPDADDSSSHAMAMYRQSLVSSGSQVCIVSVDQQKNTVRLIRFFCSKVPQRFRLASRMAPTLRFAANSRMKRILEAGDQSLDELFQDNEYNDDDDNDNNNSSSNNNNSSNNNSSNNNNNNNNADMFDEFQNNNTLSSPTPQPIAIINNVVECQPSPVVSVMRPVSQSSVMSTPAATPVPRITLRACRIPSDNPSARRIILAAATEVCCACHFLFN